MPRSHSGVLWWWLAATILCAALAFALGWRFHAPPDSQPRWKLTRLTSDAGLSTSSALSPDGKLVAYSSDRAGDGRWDLYIKQVAGGQPIRLTSDGAGNTTPDFSPDGSKLAFRSNRDGGGIYEIPAFGGEVRLLVRDGRIQSIRRMARRSPIGLAGPELLPQCREAAQSGSFLWPVGSRSAWGRISRRRDSHLGPRRKTPAVDWIHV